MAVRMRGFYLASSHQLLCSTCFRVRHGPSSARCTHATKYLINYLRNKACVYSKFPYSLSEICPLQMWLDVSASHQPLWRWDVCPPPEHWITATWVRLWRRTVTLPTARPPLCSWAPLPAENESGGIDARWTSSPAALWKATGLRSPHESDTAGAELYSKHLHL